jgi:uncharacterized protein
MNGINLRSAANPKSLFYKFILLLILVQLINNVLIYITLNTLINNPGIPKYRLICSFYQVITMILLFLFFKPTMNELGLYWADINKSIKKLYLAGGLLVILMVISSYYIMWEIRYYALLTNLNFGITTPLLEELIFRGYSWGKFKEQGYSNFKTLLITSAFFGLFHLGYYYQIAYATQFHPEAPPMINIMITKIVFTAILGLFLGLIRWKSKKVYGPIIIHSLLNIIGD